MFMQNSRDSSLWRSLAVAFGDGLAFGVGMKLTQNASKPPAPRWDAGIEDRPARLEELEQRLRRIEGAPALTSSGFDPGVLDAVVNALDARLAEHAGTVERRITEVEARLAVELQALRQQDHAIDSRGAARSAEAEARVAGQVGLVGEKFQQEIGALKGELTTLHRSFAEDVARVVEEKLAAGIAARGAVIERTVAERLSVALNAQWGPLEAQLREEAGQAAGRAGSMAAAAADAAIAGKLAPYRAELDERGREIAELRTRLSESDRTVLDLILALGRMCRDLESRVTSTGGAGGDSGPGAGVPEPPAETGTGGAGRPVAAAPEAACEAAPEAALDPLPGFAQSPEAGRLWRVPLVSSFLVTGGLLLLHYL